MLCHACINLVATGMGQEKEPVERMTLPKHNTSAGHSGISLLVEVLLVRKVSAFFFVSSAIPERVRICTARRKCGTDIPLTTCAARLSFAFHFLLSVGIS